MTVPSSGVGFISEVPAVQTPPWCLLHCCQGKLEIKDWNVSVESVIKHVGITGTKYESSVEFTFYMSQVSLLVVMEIGLFPLICGWWLDICSLVSLN